MHSGFKGLATLGLLAAIGLGSGCTNEHHENARREGLEGRDVVASSDKMAMDLLALPDLNASKNQWLIVVDHIDNMTANHREDLDIFLERLRVKIAQLGHGRVQLVENRDKLQQLQSRELDPGGGGDEFGQGGGQVPAGSGRYKPDFSLYGKIMELPNRGKSYFLCEFTLTNLHTGLQIWTNDYEVTVHHE
jgi:hypothetical protein